MNVLRKIFYRLLLYSYVAFPSRRNIFSERTVDFNTKCIIALFGLSYNGALLAIDIVMAIRLIYPYKLLYQLPEYDWIVMNIIAGLIMFMLIAYANSKGEELVAAAFAETGNLRPWEMPIAVVCTYLPFVMTFALMIKEPAWY